MLNIWVVVGYGTGSLPSILTDRVIFLPQSSVCTHEIIISVTCDATLNRISIEKALINGDWSPFDLDTVKLLMSIFVCCVCVMSVIIA